MVINANLYGSGKPEFPAFLPNGLFSVSATKKVIFSRGNLYYSASEGKYRLNPYQHAFTTSFKANYNDRFFWVKANEQTIHPYDTTYSTPYPENTVKDSLTFSDPAYLNVDGMRWRVLTQHEWAYLLTVRYVNGGTGAGHSYVNCSGGVTMLNGNTYNGLFIFPDKYTGTTDMSTLYWEELISKGIVFLPTAGYRSGSNVYNVGSDGYYLMNTPHGADKAFAFPLHFTAAQTGLYISESRSRACSVRLVSDVTDYKYMFTKHSTFVGDRLQTATALDFNGYTYFVGNDGVYRTNDMTNFTKVFTKNLGFSYYIVSAPDNEGMVLINRNHMNVSYYSPDGANWREISYVPLGNKQDGRYPVVVPYEGLGYITSLTDTSVSPVVTYSGSSFYRISTRAYENGAFICIFDGSYDSIGKFTTSNGGLTWTKVDSTTTGYIKVGDNYYIISSDNIMMQVKTPDGVIRDTNILSIDWMSFNESSFHRNFVYINGKYILSNYNEHICVSTDGGITFCSKWDLSIIQYGTSKLFKYKNRLFINSAISEDDGESWSRLPRNILYESNAFPSICNGKVYFSYEYNKGSTNCTDFYVLGEVK